MDTEMETFGSSFDAVRDEVQDLFNVSQLPTKERGDVGSLLDKVVTCSQSRGFTSNEIQLLLKACLSKTRLDSTAAAVVIDNLYPSRKISPYVVYSLVARLGSGTHKAPAAVQAHLLRWLILTSDFLEDSRSMSRVYGALFSLLSTTALRDNVCHLLYLFTEVWHVLPHRVTILNEIGRSPSANSYVTTLLNCYHAMRPDLVSNEMCIGKSAVLVCPDLAWRTRLEAIQHGGSLARDIGNYNSQFRVKQRNRFNSKRGAHLVETDLESGKEGLENVTGIKDFVMRLPRITRPRDMEAVLEDTLLQHYMATGPEDISELDEEVDSVLRAALEQESSFIIKGHAISSKTVQILRKVLEYAQFQKFLPESVETFALLMLEYSSSQQHLILILELLSWAYPDTHAWRDSILSKKTEMHIIERSQGRGERLLEYYAMVLRNRLAMLLAGTSSFEGTPPDSLTVLTSHSSYLAMSVLSQSQSVHSRDAVLQYLGTLTMLSTNATKDNDVPIISIDAPTTYLLLFACPTVSTLSYLLFLLAEYKRMFEQIVGPNPSKAASKYPPDFIKRLNGYLMDCCNLFWRSRAFSAKADDKNAAGCLLSQATQAELARYLPSINSDYTLASAFSLACHPALVGPAAAAWVEIEADKLGISSRDLVMKRRKYLAYRDSGMEIDENQYDRESMDKDAVQAIHSGPVSRLSLQRLEAADGAIVNWSQYRTTVLNWLDKRGIDGISKLMKRTMKLLMDKSRGPNLVNAANSPDSTVQIDALLAE